MDQEDRGIRTTTGAEVEPMMYAVIVRWILWESFSRLVMEAVVRMFR